MHEKLNFPIFEKFENHYIKLSLKHWAISAAWWDSPFNASVLQMASQTLIIL